MNKRYIAFTAYLIAVLLVIVAIIYFVTPADHLPAFMPGHDLAMTGRHTKHGIAAAALALGAVALGWFQSGPTQRKNTSDDPTPTTRQ